MSDNMISRVKKDLMKSGYGSEMVAIQTFLDMDWVAQGGASYVDRDENITREYDLKAHRVHTEEFGESGRLSVFMFAAAEVKKSGKPWVVFKHRPRFEAFLGEGWRNLIGATALPCSPGEIADDISWGAYSMEVKWRGYGIHEAFKSPRKRSRSFKAFVTAIKAANHIIDAELNGPVVEDREPIDLTEDRSRVCWVRPAVILDGPLLSAELDEKGELIVERIDQATFDFRFKSPGYPRQTGYFIDVVQLDFLDRWISNLEARHDHLVATLKDKAGV